MNTASDDRLMYVLRHGGEDERRSAFDELFGRYRGLTYNFAKLMLRDASHAEEVLQEAFLAVVRAAQRPVGNGGYDPRGEFRAWLMRIVRNACTNVQRTRGKESRTFLQDAAFDEVADGAPSPARRAETAERVEQARGAVEALRERQREAVVLYAYNALSYKEIAIAMGVPVNTVKTLIHRGRAAVARALEEDV